MDGKGGLEGSGEGDEKILAGDEGQLAPGEEGFGGAAGDGETEASSLGDASLAVLGEGLDGGAVGMGWWLDPGLDEGRRRDGALGWRPEGALEGSGIGREDGEGDDGAERDECAQRAGVAGGKAGGRRGLGSRGEDGLGAGLMAGPEGKSKGVVAGGPIEEGTCGGVGKAAVEPGEGVGLGREAEPGKAEDEAGNREKGEDSEEDPVEGFWGSG